ncbi:MAG TPA: glutamate 5-kinase [Kofleriaceae bacterium]|nr:glutamate 5-kinase [Kofleriaceae bacterium]
MIDAADADLRTAVFASARRIVVKVGSRLIADSPAGSPATIADDLARLRADRGIEAAIVTSGAIALGVRALGLDSRPRDLPHLQAAAAVGQGRLLRSWEHALSAHRITGAQVLLTHDDLADRRRFLNARHALLALLDAGVIPVVNENDTVGIEEIRYGDNDLLAALVANLISADALIILTDVEGVLSSADNGTRIPVIHDADQVRSDMFAGPDPGGPGSGGMASKVKAAASAARHGVATCVVPGTRPHAVRDTLAGADIGTLFLPPADSRLTSRRHWIAYAQKPVGRLIIDEGARAAVAEGKNSLLAAGVLDVRGEFSRGDIVSLLDASENELARGVAAYSAADIRAIRGLHSADIETRLGYKYLNAVIHRDDLVVL